MLGSIGGKLALAASFKSGPFQESTLNPCMPNKLAEWVVKFISTLDFQRIVVLVTH